MFLSLITRMFDKGIDFGELWSEMSIGGVSLIVLGASLFFNIHSLWFGT